MALLIDGYNLLHASGVFASGRGPHTLQRSRRALLNFLANRIGDDERPHTTIVFDAKEAPPGLPRSLKHQGMSILFAADHVEADDLIEELIRADSAPRRLTVVSSDHRIQRAARRRKATAVKSETWYADLLAQKEVVREPFETAKPALPLGQDEVQAWVDEFADVETEVVNPWPVNEAPAPAEAAPETATKETMPYEDLGNPFPPGYADDLFDEHDDVDRNRG